MQKKFLPVLCAVLCALSVLLPLKAQADTLVDIYGPGQSFINLAMASPLTGPEQRATNLGAELHSAINADLQFLPFMKLVQPSAVLGGTVLPAWQGASVDFRRFQIAGADLLVTAYWPSGDSNGNAVELRVFETFSLSDATTATPFR